jgi:uncharacterized phage-like protein YoqJ
MDKPTSDKDVIKSYAGTPPTGTYKILPGPNDYEGLRAKVAELQEEIERLKKAVKSFKKEEDSWREENTEKYNQIESIRAELQKAHINNAR